MKIVLATSNKGKVREIREILGQFDVITYTDLIAPKEIEEHGKSFKENAIIKAEAIYKELDDKDLIVLSDDSGITVPALGGLPGIYSARFAGVGATERENLEKLIALMKQKGLRQTPAFYTAAIAIAAKEGVFTVHGWMHGRVIDEARGEKGFGYDPMFIPDGYDKTLGELDEKIKQKISHRFKALELAGIILGRLRRGA